MRVPWTTRKSNQSILKEISPEKLLESEVNDGIKEEVKARNVISVPESQCLRTPDLVQPLILKKKCIYLWLCWLFVWGFSLVAASRDTLIVRVLTVVASLVERGLSSCDTRT